MGDDTTRPFAWATALVATVSVASWSVAFAGRYLLWLEYDEYLAKQLILICGFVIAVISTVTWAVLLRHRGGGAWLRAIICVSVILFASVVLLPWNGIFGRSWFAANHGKFASLSAMARQGKLHADASGYFKSPNASSLTFDHLNAEDVPIEVSPGRVLMLGMSNEAVSENAYVYVYDRPDAARLDPCKLTETTFDDYYRCTRLGDSWWWLRRK